MIQIEASSTVGPSDLAFEIRLFDILRFGISTGCLLQSKEKV